MVEPLQHLVGRVAVLLPKVRDAVGQDLCYRAEYPTCMKGKGLVNSRKENNKQQTRTGHCVITH